jgi:hypothetical protein
MARCATVRSSLVGGRSGDEHEAAKVWGGRALRGCGSGDTKGIGMAAIEPTSEVSRDADEGLTIE